MRGTEEGVYLGFAHVHGYHVHVQNQNQGRPRAVAVAECIVDYLYKLYWRTVEVAFTVAKDLRLV